MWSIIVASGWAAPAITGTAEDCSPSSEVRAWPPSGSVVSPEVHLLVQPLGTCGVPGLELTGPDAVSVGYTTFDRAGYLELVPEAPLAEGTWQLSALSYASTLATEFEVRADAPDPLPPAEPDTVEITADRRCDGALTSSATVLVRLPDAEGYGSIDVSVRTEHGEQGRSTTLPAEEHVATFAGMLGGTEVCAVVSASAPDGTVFWETDPVCAEPFAGCEDEASLRDDVRVVRGCAGCATGGDPGWAALAALLVILRRQPRAT